MNNSIFDILKLLYANQPQNQYKQTNINNPSFSNYPSEAFSQNFQSLSNNNQQSPFAGLTNGDSNNILPLLMSMLGKGGDLSKIFSQSTPKKENDEIKKETSSPKDEILL